MSDQQAQELDAALVEIVAQAIFQDDLKDEGGGTWESHDDGEKEAYRSNARAALLAARSVQVERPDDDAAAIVEWFVRMQANAEASYIIEAAAEAIANADGWHWHDEDYESPDPKWQPTDKAEYRETARKAFAAARSVAAARLPEQPEQECARCRGTGTGPGGMAVEHGNRCIACHGSGRLPERPDEGITDAMVTHVRAELHRWAIPYLEGPQDPDEAKALAPRLRGLADALAARPVVSEGDRQRASVGLPSDGSSDGA